ncbi:MAG: ABC transporter permease [Thermoplasmata archaeon]|nr:ABC transporter permease [Thermoplasmata archaeon]
MNGRRVVADFLVFARGYFRSPIGLFFSLVFPIILIILFGVIFQNSGQSAVNLPVVNMDHNSAASLSFLSALNNTSVVKVQVVTLPAGMSLSTWLGNQGDPVGLIVPSGFGADFQGHTNVSVTVITDPSDAFSSGVVLGAVQGVTNQFNFEALHGAPFVSVQTATVGSASFTELDYLVPGLIGFSILTSPMFSMVEITSTYRKEGLFRQLTLTPLTRSEWLLAKILWYVVITGIAACLMVFIGAEAFNIHIVLSVYSIPFLIIGPLMFVSLGMLAGSISRTPETAAIVGNVVTFPMMFLSGTFFPVSSFSPGLQDFAHVLPLYYIIDGLDQTMLFGNTGRALIDLAVCIVIALVFFIAAVITFKWREE